MRRDSGDPRSCKKRKLKDSSRWLRRGRVAAYKNVPQCQPIPSSSVSVCCNLDDKVNNMLHLEEKKSALLHLRLGEALFIEMPVSDSFEMMEEINHERHSFQKTLLSICRKAFEQSY